MAESVEQQGNQAHGYQYQFVDSVPEDYLCYECKLVAKNLTFTGCCGETFCKECIERYKQEEKPCPSCKIEGIVVLKQVKYQLRIRKLSVFCDLKERGCDWKGAVEEVDTHLDPELDNCQYVDIQCPLNCQQLIPKNMMEGHLENECVKRNFFCQHCNHKATYEEIQNVHLPECKYVPVQCPNMCGVTCEREDLEDHLNTCRLQEIECQFAKLGCDEMFFRENEEEHMAENNLKHVMLVATHSLKSKKEFEEKMEAQRQEIEAQLKEYEERQKEYEAQQEKYEKENETLTEKLKNEEENVKDLEGKVSDLETKLDNGSNDHDGRIVILEEIKAQDRLKKLEDENAELQKTLKENKEKLDKLNKILEGQGQQNDGLKAKVAVQEEQILGQKATLENRKKEFDKKLEEANKRYNQLESDVKKQERRLAAHAKGIDDVSNKCKQLAVYRVESTTNTKRLEQGVKDLAKLRNELSENVKKLDDKTKENKTTIAGHENAISKLQARKQENPLEEMKRLREMLERHVERFVRLEEKLPKVNAISDYLGNFERTFEIKGFSVEKEKDKPRDWKSPAMYTHMCGYKFCIGLDANGRGGSHGEAIYAELYVMPGEYDSLLRWPAKASFTLEVIHQRGGKNVKYNTAMKKWEKPELNFKCLSVFPYTEVNNSYCFLEHNKLGDFLVNDTLKFFTSVTLH